MSQPTSRQTRRRHVSERYIAVPQVGELIASVPLSTVTDLGPEELSLQVGCPPGGCTWWKVAPRIEFRDDGRRQAVHLLDQHVQEAAAAWIRRMHADPAYSARYQLYLDTLPTADEVLAPELWTPAMVAALQSPELVRHCRHSTAKKPPSAAP